MSSKPQVYKIRINYRSGISEEFEVTKFEVKIDGVSKDYSWTYPPGQIIRPIQFNADAVESVWQVGVRDG